MNEPPKTCEACAKRQPRELRDSEIYRCPVRDRWEQAGRAVHCGSFEEEKGKDERERE